MVDPSEIELTYREYRAAQELFCDDPFYLRCNEDFIIEEPGDNRFAIPANELDSFVIEDYIPQRGPVKQRSVKNPDAIRPDK